MWVQHSSCKINLSTKQNSVLVLDIFKRPTGKFHKLIVVAI